MAPVTTAASPAGSFPSRNPSFPPVISDNHPYVYVDFRVERRPWNGGSTIAPLRCDLDTLSWLEKLWPCYVESGRQFKLVKRLGSKKVYVHTLYAQRVHQQFHFKQATALDGNFLNWTPENIVPVRCPSRPAGRAEVEHIARRVIDRPLPRRVWLPNGPVLVNPYGDAPGQIPESLALEWEQKIVPCRSEIDAENFWRRKVTTMSQPLMAAARNMTTALAAVDSEVAEIFREAMVVPAKRIRCCDMDDEEDD